MNNKGLNNKGFAITGVLYSLFILFLMLFLLLINGLSARKTTLERSILSLEDSFSGSVICSSEDECASIITSDEATYDGRYEFSVAFESGSITGENVSCVSYLLRGTALDDNITFVPDDCNDYSIGDMTLVKVISFESE